MKYVAYYRVSTKRQGRSGLGLEAQQRDARHLAGEHGLLSEYTDIETGKSTTRPQLQAAIQHAQLAGAVLVVAKLDRLARNAAFLLQLQESGLEFVCCDNPNANRLTIGLMAVIAQHEAECISERTKAALQSAKLRGVQLGAARPGWAHHQARLRGLQTGRAVSIRSRQRAAKEFIGRIRTLVESLQGAHSMEQIVDHLNRQGYTTRQKRPFTLTRLRQLLSA